MKQSLKYIFPLLTFICGTYIGVLYANQILSKRLNDKFSLYSQNIDKIKWDSLIDVSMTSRNRVFTFVYRNKSSIFNLDAVKTKIVLFKQNKSDTASLILREGIKAQHRVSVDVSYTEYDSIKILKSTIISKSINF